MPLKGRVLRRAARTLLGWARPRLGTGARTPMQNANRTFDPETYAAAAAPLLGLDLDEAWTASVCGNLRVLAAAAALIMDFPLPDETEAAPRFEA